MVKRIRPQKDLPSSILGQIFYEAEFQKIVLKDLAVLAGIRPESLSRIRRRGSAGLDVVERLAQAVGMQLRLVPGNPIAEQIQLGTFFSRDQDGSP